MDKLLQNAVESIQLGVEDYQSNDPRRPLSAARNFFAGVLLLAKHTLIKAAPNADPDIVIGFRMKPVSDGAGGMRMEAEGNQTIDFGTLGKRLKDFDIKVDQASLRDLNATRNDIEHRYTNQTGIAVKEAIAKAFPVVADLFRELGEMPAIVLGNTWTVMLGVKDVYDRELKLCQDTFSKVNWNSLSLRVARRMCPSCRSELLAQNISDNSAVEQANATCQSCGDEVQAEKLVEHVLELHYDSETYSAAMDGNRAPVHTCPNCNVDAYLTTAFENGCVWCGEALGKCGLCRSELTPSDVSFESMSLCSYCANLLSKDY